MKEAFYPSPGGAGQAIDTTPSSVRQHVTYCELDGMVHVLNLGPGSPGCCCMRIVLLLVVLLLAACEGSFVRSGDLGRKVNIDKSYEARDACLSRNAAADGTIPAT